MSRNRIAFRMEAPDRPLAREEGPTPVPAAGEVLVEIAGCGICHTDLAFWSGRVRPNHPLPLVLGHEVAGRVVEAGAGCEGRLGQAVIVPAVLPCGECTLCRGGRANACRAQKMPGNDFPGGFASHLLVSGQSVVAVDPPLPGHELWELAVVADAVTTPYQAAVRAGLEPGDVALFVGLGGIGAFGVQIAAAMGATVFGIDVDPAKIRRLEHHGLTRGFDCRETDARSIRSEIATHCRSAGLPALGWKVFETSGTTAGQEMAFGLLTHTGVLAIVGFTPDKVALRLSNLMAFDATAFGSWGCDPAHYPAVLDRIRGGQIALRPFVRRFPLEDVNLALGQVSAHAFVERAVLVP